MKYTHLYGQIRYSGYVKRHITVHKKPAIMFTHTNGTRIVTGKHSALEVSLLMGVVVWVDQNINKSLKEDVKTSGRTNVRSEKISFNLYVS